MSVPHRTTLTGPFPRPEHLVKATRDLDRGRIDAAAAEEAFGRAEREVAEVEAELKLDTVTGGYLRWADLFRPFTLSWKGVSAGPLTRFFETNTFYRQPLLDAAPERGSETLERWLPRGETARAILPGPYTFAHLAEVRYAGGDRTTAVADIARALAAELRALGPRPPRHVQFQEPLLGYAPFVGDAAPLVDAYRVLVDACNGATTTVWTFFGDAGRSIDALLALPVDIVGVDLFEFEVPRPLDLRGKGLGLGVVESRTTLSENVAEIARIARSVEGALRPSSVWLGPSPPLDLLPFEAARDKLAILPQLKEALAA